MWSQVLEFPCRKSYFLLGRWGKGRLHVSLKWNSMFSWTETAYSWVFSPIVVSIGLEMWRSCNGCLKSLSLGSLRQRQFNITDKLLFSLHVGSKCFFIKLHNCKFSLCFRFLSLCVCRILEGTPQQFSGHNWKGVYLLRKQLETADTNLESSWTLFFLYFLVTLI